jgi:hypothetical protein
MTRFTLTLSLLALPLLWACPDPPTEVMQSAEGLAGDDPSAAKRPNKGGPEGDPSAMDLSPGGTLLLDMSSVTPQKTQAELQASGDPLVKISGTLQGSCEGGLIRIDLIEVGISHTDTGPMVGPITALTPQAAGEYTLLAPAGKTYQLAALCDIDKDNKIVQDTDKLAPGISLGEVTEDKTGIDLVFPGEGDTPVEVGSPGAGGVTPPGDNTASLPSTEAGARDRGEAVPPPPEDEQNAGAPPSEGEAVPPPPEDEQDAAAPPPSQDEAIEDEDADSSP